MERLGDLLDMSTVQKCGSRQWATDLRVEHVHLSCRVRRRCFRVGIDGGSGGERGPSNQKKKSFFRRTCVGRACNVGQKV
jgi:hypothetical protein